MVGRKVGDAALQYIGGAWVYLYMLCQLTLVPA